MEQSYGESIPQPDLRMDLPKEIMDRVERGRKVKTMVLEGTERPNKGVGLYAKTHVKLDFTDEENLLNCVKLLKWSDDRLSKLPDLLAHWDWQMTIREGMTLYFTTGWYNKDFFEERNTAFLGRTHGEYYKLFGAKPEDLSVEHEILAK
jgi:hypothetical protein